MHCGPVFLFPFAARFRKSHDLLLDSRVSSDMLVSMVAEANIGLR